MGRPDWHLTMFHIHHWKLLWLYCPEESSGDKANDQAHRLVCKSTITRGTHLGRSEVLRSLRHYLNIRTHSKGITRKASKRQDAAHVGFGERLRYHLELN